MKLHLCESLERARSVARALVVLDCAEVREDVRESETEIRVGDHRVLWLSPDGRSPFADCEPRDHRDAWRDWRRENLPLDPGSEGGWRLKLKPSCSDLVERLSPALKSASLVVHHGRATAAGQWAVDEAMRQCGADPARAKRVWAVSCDPDDLASAIRNAAPNARRLPLSDGAEARRRADWLARINFSRLFTLADRARGGTATCDVDRVATAALRIASRLEGRRPGAARVIVARLKHAGGTFEAEAVAEGPDADGQARDLLDAEGRVAAFEERVSDGERPLPHDAPRLLAAASRRGVPAGRALAKALELHDAGLLTCPVSERRELSAASAARAGEIVASLASVPEFEAEADAADPSEAGSGAPSVGGIVPTPMADAAAFPDLDRDSRIVMEEAAKAFLAALAPSARRTERRVAVDVGGQIFKTRGVPADVPAARKGERVTVADAETRAKVESVRLDEASLLEAMADVRPFVSDRDGRLGSVPAPLARPDRAVRALECLIDRGQIVRDGSALRITARGQETLERLPSGVCEPLAAAVWERAFREADAAAREAESVLDAYAETARQLTRKAA